MNGVAVIVLNWNGAALTQRCLDSLTKLNSQPDLIVVVDNGSTEQLNLIHRLSPPVTLLRSPTNLGFGGGVNLGIQQAFKNPAIRFVWILNNDTVVAAESLDELLKACHQPHVGMAGARMMRLDTMSQIENRGIALSSWGLAWNIVDETTPCSVLSAGSILARRDMLEQVSPDGEYFDPHFFLYMEDVDFGLRVLKRGWKQVIAEKAVVWHAGSASTKKIPTETLYYWQRNSIWMLVKNFPWLTLCVQVVPMLFLHLGIMLVYTLRGQGKVVLKAKWDGCTAIPGLLRHRKQIHGGLNHSEFRGILQPNWKGLVAWWRIQFPSA